MRIVPSWSQYFMNGAIWASTRSKDPNTQVGAVVINKDNHVIGTGYNGMPPGMVEDTAIWERPTKYDYVCHAELNAISNCTEPAAGGKIYVTLYPCRQCAKLIAANKIRKVYYKEHELEGKDYLDKISQDIFKRSGIEVIQVK